MRMGLVGGEDGSATFIPAIESVKVSGLDDCQRVVWKKAKPHFITWAVKVDFMPPNVAKKNVTTSQLRHSGRFKERIGRCFEEDESTFS